MALAAHTTESTMEIPARQAPRVRIKNRLVGTIVARCTQFPHYPRVKYRIRMPDGGASLSSTRRRGNGPLISR